MRTHGGKEFATADNISFVPTETTQTNESVGPTRFRSDLPSVPLTAEHQILVDLLRRSGQGDEDAFSAFYQLTMQRTYSLTRRILVNTEIAQDTTQEIYLTVWQEARRYDPTLGNPFAWLLTIAHRKAVDKVRAEQSSSARAARWAIANHSPDYDSVAETVATRLEAQTVITCLRNLSPVQREAINLAYYGGLTYREVSEHLSIPLSTTKTRIRDGLKNLRTCLDEVTPR